MSIRQFKIHCDFKLQDPQLLQAELDGMSRDIELLIGRLPDSETVHIVLFETQAEYVRYMRNYFPKLPERRALFIQDRGPGMLFTHWHADIATDLRHEVSHALLNHRHHHLPIWLDEGLAEYHEVSQQQRFGGSDYLQEVKRRSAAGLVPDLGLLEQLDKTQAFGDEHYRDSWSWVHFLLHRNPQTRQLLIAYLQGARSGAQQLPLSRQLDGLLENVGNEYQQHFASLQPSVR